MNSLEKPTESKDIVDIDELSKCFNKKASVNEAKVEPKVEPKVESKVEPKVESKTEPKAEATNDILHIESFWKSIEGKRKPTQLERYEKMESPDVIKQFIKLGGGPTMGTILEKYARYTFKCLNKRKGKKVTGEKTETGYDHLMIHNSKEIYIEQKSSGHWGYDDYKWQHIETKHKWTMLLLCGIDYKTVQFWAMNRSVFNNLVNSGKITNQGNKEKESSEGMWFMYSDVKDHLIPIQSEKDLQEFVASLPVAD